MRLRLLLFSGLLFCVLAFAGCDGLNVSKVDNPVFGPPPPRMRQAEEPAGRIALADEGAVTDSEPGARDAGVRQTTFGVEKSPDRMLSDNDVIATVNGKPIFAAEIFDKYGIALAAARKAVDEGKATPADVRQFQDKLIRDQIAGAVKARLLSQAMESKLDKEQKEKLDEAVSKMYADYVDDLKKKVGVNSRHEVDAELAKQGTSLASVYNEFKVNAMASAYEREKTNAKAPPMIGRPEMLTYYQEHIADFTVPTRVKWNLLHVSFEKHGGKKQALDVLEQALNEVKTGVDFRKVVAKHSDGPRATQGGVYGWTDPASISDKQTAEALVNVPRGDLSPVIVNADHFRVVQIADREEARQRKFAEVQDSIKSKILNAHAKQAGQGVFDELVQHADIRSPYVKNRKNPNSAETAENPDKPAFR